jgi:hypothetical protein
VAGKRALPVCVWELNCGEIERLPSRIVPTWPWLFGETQVTGGTPDTMVIELRGWTGTIAKPLVTASRFFD